MTQTDLAKQTEHVRSIMERSCDLSIPPEPTTICPEVIEAFTNGWCWALAVALAAQLPNAEVIGLGSDVWLHVLLRTPDGRFLDVRGLRTWDEVRDEWGQVVHHLSDADWEWMDERCQPHVMESSRSVAAAVIAATWPEKAAVGFRIEDGAGAGLYDGTIMARSAGSVTGGCGAAALVRPTYHLYEFEGCKPFVADMTRGARWSRWVQLDQLTVPTLAERRHKEGKARQG